MIEECADAIGNALMVCLPAVAVATAVRARDPIRLGELLKTFGAKPRAGRDGGWRGNNARGATWVVGTVYYADHRSMMAGFRVNTAAYTSHVAI